MTQTSSPIVPQPGIMKIALYEGGASKLAGVENVVKLSSNENPFGPSEKAREAVIRAAHALHRYPNTDHAGLRAAIAEVHGLDPDRIICGVGSDEIIHFLCQAYAGPETEVLFTEHGFLMYRISAHAAGATPVQVRERDRVTDIDALIAGATERTRLIFVANPNNPTGTMVGLPELERLARAVPQAILVIDAAYCEYVGDYDGGAELATRLPNVFMTRTFSKIYGLGGLRVGWGYGAREIVDVLNRIRGPFNLSHVALEGAEAAVQDRDHVARCQAENARLRAWLAEALAEKGVPSDTSCANFVLARFADQDTAVACDEALKSQGLIVRRVAGYGLPNCLRVTVGDEASCRRVAHVIGQFMAERAGTS
ncbi:histidinol phosphate aminotransferase apoenzyme [Paracoccus halophilus]|uniref:Histidinol-phosphate aminotransferase n=1 Tax=Paracoccus halophilus TaxID=376733 RepID=A0A099F1X7_9RHOB|nr:histidinol-phosphate transaminase [Paracoccus halophilus]KGJ04162.1 histidinol-phosphate aminotransferase [Paracoccus halophilus]SFA55643.1 histidinol phosphate aminotransferase apoenzyme [Paracoccus halophilus]